MESVSLPQETYEISVQIHLVERHNTYVVLIDHLSGETGDIEGVECDLDLFADFVEFRRALRELGRDFQLMYVSVKVKVSIEGVVAHGKVKVGDHDAGIDIGEMIDKDRGSDDGVELIRSEQLPEMVKKCVVYKKGRKEGQDC